MTDKPIIFSAPMIAALLAGTKTQTRRVAKITAVMGNKVPVTAAEERLIELEAEEFRRGICHYESTSALSGPYRLPYRVGDRLWVREAWRIDGAGRRVSAEACRGHRSIQYRADGYDPRPHDERSPIHMPRWASRLTLLVTDVRVLRLREISEDDARAEGVCSTLTRFPDGGSIGHPASWHFEQLWGQIHGPGAWDSNPWVCAITFDVQRGNIDDTEVKE